MGWFTPFNWMPTSHSRCCKPIFPSVNWQPNFEGCWTGQRWIQCSLEIKWVFQGDFSKITGSISLPHPAIPQWHTTYHSGPRKRPYFIFLKKVSIALLLQRSPQSQVQLLIINSAKQLSGFEREITRKEWKEWGLQWFLAPQVLCICFQCREQPVK